MRRNYDVIVVGGGPAGATATLRAARLGLSVLLVEKRRFPRDKVCGDAVARKPLDYLRKLGLLEGVLDQSHEAIGAVVLGAPGGATVRFDLTEKPPGGGSGVMPYIVCRRERFDDVLFDAARSEADVLEGRPVTALLSNDGVVNGVRTEDGAYRSGVVIGADGFRSIVARARGLYHYDTHRWFVATRGYYRGLDCPPNTAEVHFTADTLPGFLWLFPCGGGLTNVGLGMIHRDIERRGSLRQVHERVLSSPRFSARFQNAERIGDVRGWTLPTPDFSRAVHGAGFILAGDAAGLVDPFTGEGIGNAMGSGWVAAGVVAAASRRGDFSAASLSEYPTRLWKELDAGEVELHYRLRRLARRGRLIDCLVERAAHNRGTLEWLTAMTSRHGAVQRKRELTSPLSYLKLLFR